MINIPPKTPPVPLPTRRDRPSAEGPGKDFQKYLKAEPPIPREAGERDTAPRDANTDPGAGDLPLDQTVPRSNREASIAHASPNIVQAEMQQSVFAPKANVTRLPMNSYLQADAANAPVATPMDVPGQPLRATVELPNVAPGSIQSGASADGAHGPIRAGIKPNSIATKMPSTPPPCVDPASMPGAGIELVSMPLVEAGDGICPASGKGADSMEGCGTKGDVPATLITMSTDIEQPEQLDPPTDCLGNVASSEPGAMNIEVPGLRSGATPVEPDVHDKDRSRPPVHDATPPLSTPAPPPQTAVQVQTRIGQDNQDWIIRPWRLQANAGLSFRSNHSLAGEQEKMPVPATMGRLGGQARSAFGDTGDVSDSMLPAAWKSLLGLPVQIETVSGSIEADGVDPSDPLAAGGRQMAAWLQWPERLLRWHTTPSNGNGVTAWVRDFSLGADEIPRLVVSLLALSEEQGFSLDRIMINGREEWAANGGSQPTGTDDNAR